LAKNEGLLADGSIKLEKEVLHELLNNAGEE
jgi:hypothetical protein